MVFKADASSNVYVYISGAYPIPGPGMAIPPPRAGHIEEPYQMFCWGSHFFNKKGPVMWRNQIVTPPCPMGSFGLGKTLQEWEIAWPY